MKQIKLIEVAKRLRKYPNQLTYMARAGVFKTAVKLLEDHRMVWYLDEEEAEEFIKNYSNKNESK